MTCVGMRSSSKVLNMKNVIYLCDLCLQRSRNEWKREVEEVQEKYAQMEKEECEDKSTQSSQKREEEPLAEKGTQSENPPSKKPTSVQTKEDDKEGPKKDHCG